MANNNRKKLFDKFLSGGFAQVNKLEAAQDNILHIASTYNWNFSKIISTDKEINILDIGCGLGQFLYWLKEKDYKNYSGVDLSQEMVDFCKKNVTEKVAKIDSVKEFLANKEEVYDLIVMNDVVEHLEKNGIIENLEIIRKSLKKGGMLLVKTNNAAAITGARMRFEDFTHETAFTEYSLKQVLKVAGFNNIKIFPFDMPRTNSKRWLRFIAQAILHFIWRLIYFFEFTTVPSIVNEFMFAVAIKE